MKDRIVEIYKSALKKIVQYSGANSRAGRIALYALNEAASVESAEAPKP